MAGSCQPAPSRPPEQSGLSAIRVGGHTDRGTAVHLQTDTSMALVDGGMQGAPSPSLMHEGKHLLSPHLSCCTRGSTSSLVASFQNLPNTFPQMTTYPHPPETPAAIAALPPLTPPGQHSHLQILPQLLQVDVVPWPPHAHRAAEQRHLPAELHRRIGHLRGLQIE